MGNLVKTPLSEINSTLEVWDKLGITPEHFARIRADHDYASRTAEFMRRGGIEGSIHQKLARATLGKNFFGAEDWASLYGVNFTKKQLCDVAEFPWGEDVLTSPCPFVKGKLVKDTHFAFLGISKFSGEPLTVAKWLEIHPKTGQPRFYFADNPWHTGQPHTDKATLELCWYLLLKDIVPDSTDKTPEEQVTMLPTAIYEVPITIAEVTKDILVFRKTGERPNHNRWAACQERTVKTAQVDAGNVSCVGNFDENGLNVNNWNGNRNSNVGVSAARNFYPVRMNKHPLKGCLCRPYPAPKHPANLVNTFFKINIFLNIYSPGVFA